MLGWQLSPRWGGQLSPPQQPSRVGGSSWPLHLLSGSCCSGSSAPARVGQSSPLADARCAVRMRFVFGSVPG